MRWLVVVAALLLFPSAAAAIYNRSLRATLFEDARALGDRLQE